MRSTGGAPAVQLPSSREEAVLMGADDALRLLSALPPLRSRSDSRCWCWVVGMTRTTGMEMALRLQHPHLCSSQCTDKGDEGRGGSSIGVRFVVAQVQSWLPIDALDTGHDRDGARLRSRALCQPIVCTYPSKPSITLRFSQLIFMIGICRVVFSTYTTWVYSRRSARVYHENISIFCL